MKQFLIGLTAGLGIAAAGLGAFSVTAANDAEPNEWQRKLSAQLTRAITNLKLEKHRPDLEGKFTGNIANDFPQITVNALDPLESLSRQDIAHTCISAFADNDEALSTYSARLWLTADAKRRVGSALAAHDNREISIQLWGMQINAFFADTNKAKLFAEGREEEKELADISFIFEGNSTYQGLMFLSALTGQGEHTACDGSFDIDALEGYQYHLKFWQEFTGS